MALLDWLRGVLQGTGPTALEDLGVRELTTLPELDALFTESDTRPMFVLKHSTTCPISASAYRRVADYLQAAGPDAPPVYLIKVIESRPLSNELAQRLGIRHESPQCILLHHRAPAWHASHGSITAPAMATAATSLPT